MSEENSPLRPWIDPEIEARIVALVLGETSDFEREELERQIAANRDLAEYRQRIESAHGLLNEIVEHENTAARGESDWQLPESVQASLLATFEREPDAAGSVSETQPATAASTVPANPVATEFSSPARSGVPWRKMLAIAALMAAMAVIGGLMMPLSSRRGDFSINREEFGASDYDHISDQRDYGTPPPMTDLNGPTSLASSATHRSERTSEAASDSNDRARAALLAMNESFSVGMSGESAGGEYQSAFGRTAGSGDEGTEPTLDFLDLNERQNFSSYREQKGSDDHEAGGWRMQQGQVDQFYSGVQKDGGERDLGRLSVSAPLQNENQAIDSLKLPALAGAGAADATIQERVTDSYEYRHAPSRDMRRSPEEGKQSQQAGGYAGTDRGKASQQGGAAATRGREQDEKEQHWSGELAEVTAGMTDRQVTADDNASVSLPIQLDGRDEEESESLMDRPAVALSKKVADISDLDGAVTSEMAAKEAEQLARQNLWARNQAALGDVEGAVALGAGGDLLMRSSADTGITVHDEEAGVIPSAGDPPVLGRMFGLANGAENRPTGEADVDGERLAELSDDLAQLPSKSRELRELSALAQATEKVTATRLARRDEEVAAVKAELGQQTADLTDELATIATNEAKTVSPAFVAESATESKPVGSGGGMGGGGATVTDDFMVADSKQATGVVASTGSGAVNGVVAWSDGATAMKGAVVDEAARSQEEGLSLSAGGILDTSGAINGGTISVDPGQKTSVRFRSPNTEKGFYRGFTAEAGGAGIDEPSSSSGESPSVALERRFATESDDVLRPGDESRKQWGWIAPAPGQGPATESPTPAPTMGPAAAPPAPQPSGVNEIARWDANREAGETVPVDEPGTTHLYFDATSQPGAIAGPESTAGKLTRNFDVAADAGGQHSDAQKQNNVEVGARFGNTQIVAGALVMPSSGNGQEAASLGFPGQAPSDQPLFEAEPLMVGSNGVSKGRSTAEPDDRFKEVSGRQLASVTNGRQVVVNEKSPMPVDLDLGPEVVEFEGFINYGKPIQTVEEGRQLHITTKFVEVDAADNAALGFDWLLDQPGSDANRDTQPYPVARESDTGASPAKPPITSWDEKGDDYLSYSSTVADKAMPAPADNSSYPTRKTGQAETVGVTRGLRSGGFAVTDDSIDGLIVSSGGIASTNANANANANATAPMSGVERYDYWYAKRHDADSDIPLTTSFAVTPATPTSRTTRDADGYGIEREFIYPAEYDPPEIVNFSGGGLAWATQLAEVPEALAETATAEEPFSTFSLHVSDVSFKLAQAALANGEWPEAERIRIEEFVNAFDYGDPMPNQKEKVACQIEQSIHPFLQQRNLLRISMRTAAAGRSGATPLRLTLLLDSSGSMERHDRQETVQRAIALLAGQLQPTDQVTLIGFARTPRLLADRIAGDARQQLVHAVANTPSEGGTHLESALDLAFEKALEQQAENAQNRVILLTDGAANLGDANPDSLATKVVGMREAGIAFDAAGFGADGLNDEILEALTRQGDGRYYLLDRPEDADEGFARQIAGALRPAAMNVKVQIEFNPDRVASYKLLGFEKHRLNKEDFRDDKVDAAEIAAEEAGVAVYQFEPLADGEGDVGTAFLRFRDMASGEMVEKSWPIPYAPNAPRPGQAAPSVRLATVASLFAAKLKGDALGESVDLGKLTQLLAGLPEPMANLERVTQLRQMIEQARNLEGQ